MAVAVPFIRTEVRVYVCLLYFPHSSCVLHQLKGVLGCGRASGPLCVQRALPAHPDLCRLPRSGQTCCQSCGGPRRQQPGQKLSTSLMIRRIAELCKNKRRIQARGPCVLLGLCECWGAGRSRPGGAGRWTCSRRRTTTCERLHNSLLISDLRCWG